MEKNTLKSISSSLEINNYLSNVDPIMDRIIKVCGSVYFTLEENYFVKLCKTIIGQQLSNKVAKTIIQRFMNVLDNDISPENILKIYDEDFRKIGLSYSKISYIKNLATAVQSNGLNLHEIELLSDAEVISQLTLVKGIGKWTAEMFLIFSLGRYDVFSNKDGGLNAVIMRLYRNYLDIDKQANIDALSTKWSPYRSIASLYLWELLNRNLLDEVDILVNTND